MKTLAWYFLICPFFAGTMIISARGAEAAESAPMQIATPRQDLVELNAGVGIKCMFAVGWASVPAPVAVVLNADVLRYLRIHGEFTYQIVEGIKRGTTGLGAVFAPVGRHAFLKTTGFQLKIPVLFELGLLNGETEAGDGYSDFYDWLLLGPSSGLDVTWWFKGKIGVRASFNLGYMFRIDLGSSYADEPYSYARDDIGTLEASWVLGIVI